MKILIAGSGKMGSDIFYYILPYGYEMFWLCLNELEAEKVRQQFAKKVSRQLRAGILDQSSCDALFDRVTITSDISGVADTDLVIECIWEQASEKKALFKKLDEYLPKDALLTSNTSSVLIRALIPSEMRKSRVCGLHFFFPAALKNLVEVNVPEEFDPEALDQIKSFLARIGRNALVLRGTDHFIMNRLLLPVQNEAVAIMQEYPMHVAELDALVRTHLFPVGIFEFFDHVGNDVMLASVSNYIKYFPDGNDYTPLLEMLRKKVQENLLGLKTGIGFYEHPLDPASFQCNLPEMVRAALVHRLEKSWYGAIREFMTRKVVDPKQFDVALMEYWGEDVSFLEKGRLKGYFV